MLSTKDFFYGQAEPIWISKAEKKESKKGDEDSSASSDKKETEKPYYPIWPIHTASPYHPYQLNYNPEYIPTPAKRDENEGKGAGNEKNKETKVVLKVPMCCSECEDRIKVALYGLGVKSVDCNSHKEKVTVVTTTAAPADILLECRRNFKKSRMWSDDD